MKDTMDKYEKKFIGIKGESHRYLEEVNKYIYESNREQQEKVSIRRANKEIDICQLMNEKAFFKRDFLFYTQKLFGLEFQGKVIIRPYSNLFEAVLDGVHGCFDVGLWAMSMRETDTDYLFAIKIPGKEDKAFAYVLYDEEGKMIRARQAFNLDVINPHVLHYIELFSKDILIPNIINKKEVKTA